MKRCPNCEKTKPDSAFYRDYSNRRTNSWCKECQKDSQRERYARSNHATARKACYQRALAHLRDIHYEEFQTLYSAELRRNGFEPAQASQARPRQIRGSGRI